ncbi:ScbA/BarX family gamma-butyrolactone biosynthesis protein [Streptomyces millisiae]|uniref:ScbA/BarX family gamma-butyrolactone biosynthesis protein n=1 Tax=Streptomyces millisiae TaxID=3075542 RepID=A0ABU2LRM7_9ACTN|nr:ScbA/BarX family gamma-butyrolactone biosynthesis protein [Streptomyces sp. DSM 44918]MDT0319923.1 ScbA/BarX family gamma-butyrolactone biosynthesis protein [Streptomyces sp. DSM 44918]
MSTTSFTRRQPSAATPPDDLDLDFSRTVDRLLVHRDALGEVFLTDLRRIDDESYAAAAQLPRSHAYYGDHQLRPSFHDPLLLLEACRQANLAGAHRFYGVAEDDKFILTHLRLTLTHLPSLVVGPAPLPLVMRVRVVNRKERDGRVTGLDYAIELWVDDTVVGTSEMGLRFKTPTDYLTLRLNNRGGRALPSSATLPHVTPGTPVPPHLVGRHAAQNVVLVDAATTGATGHAGLRTPADHPSMFDHPQDHLPGMVITEGARQLALFTALDVCGMSAAKVFPTDIDVHFTRFGELEDETVLTAEANERVRIPSEPTDPGVYYTQGGLLELPESGEESLWNGGGAALEQLPVRVEARQRDELLCAVNLTLTRVSLG